MSPSCKQAARLQSDSLDRKLRLSERLGLRLHLLLCKWCRRYGQQVRFLRDAARRNTEKLAGPGTGRMSDEARERIKRSLQDKGH
ncbi:MAG TPA: zf-HC2 domain-containing protein [Verrucomicrobiae bacterium]|nr:zf-HC2 domain-containing protein [Verrucomicrobiae bacterium]